MNFMTTNLIFSYLQESVSPIGKDREQVLSGLIRIVLISFGTS